MVRVVHWAFIVFLSLVGALLTLGGAALVWMGGNYYYVLAGLAVVAVVVQLIRRRGDAALIYAAILTLTVFWAFFESGRDFLSILPRLAAWMVVGGWFLTPWYRSTIRQDRNVLGLSSLQAPGFALALGAVALIFAATAGYTQNGRGTERTGAIAAAKGEWRHYGNDAGGSRFSGVDDINLETVSGLKEVWRFRTGVDDDFKMTPIQVGSLLYICGARNVLIAIDAETGSEVWRYDPAAEPATSHQYARTCRGISYHETLDDYDGECPARILTATIDARLLAVDAISGRPCTSFGEGGSVDLRRGLGPHPDTAYYVTSPPLVAGNSLVVGGLVNDNQNLGMPSGVVRAFDAITGEFVWAWDLGRPGERGEPAEGEAYTRGTPNVWSIMSYDPELGLIYAPTGNAAPDYFGGARRPFDDEWSSAVVALDAATGDPRWKYQTVHHDIWDYDVPAQPVLVDVERDGDMVPSIAIPTKTGDIFLLDRRNGEPVHPTPEVAVPQSPAEGEYLSPTQPKSPLPHFHPVLRERDMWGLTPIDQMLCRIEYHTMRNEGLFTPPVTGGGSLQFPANFGGFNWGSVSVDADHGLLVAAPMLLANRTILVTPEQVAEAGPQAALLLGQDHPAVHMDPDSPLPPMGDPDPDDPYDHQRIKYYGLTMPFMARIGTQVPCFEPPWSRLAVIDLNTKELLWSRPIGSMKSSGPFGWRSGLPFQVGTPVRAGTLTTRGGLTFMSSTMDATVRAFNVRTGKVVWADDLPGNSQATPMTYVAPQSGRQTLIVTVPNPSWRYPRDPANGTYTDSKSIRDGQGGYVIAYALDG
ncbi:MAG: PQQ-binding-like beta-propeller repeat protein [Pseudomonadota bacterium]